MKRVLSVLLLIAVFIPIFSSLCCVSAQDVKAEEATAGAQNSVNTDSKADVEDILYFSCVYDAESKTVNVSGTMKHDAFAEHNNSSLEIFLIPPGKTEYEIANDPAIEPIAQTSVSIKFGFNFKATSLVDRYSRYAIFLKSPEGERILATEAQYAEVQSTFVPSESKKAFKGISGSGAAKASYVDADTAIIPVYIDMLFTKTSDGYIYQVDKEKLFFSHGYIDELDRKINSASISGSGIYLQLLLRNGSSLADECMTDAQYVLPHIYDETVLTHIHSAVEFLASRYSLLDSVKTFGFVVGKGWDDYKRYNYCEEVSFENYVELCGFYSIAVANAARGVNSGIDVVLPFTGDGLSDAAEGDTQKDRFAVMPLLRSVIEYYEESFSMGITVSVLVDSKDTPLNITNQNLSQGIDVSGNDDSKDFVAGNQTDFSAWLKNLSANYSGTLGGYMFVWTPSSALSGNALTTAYAYSYYKLLTDSNVSSFCIHFDDDAENTLNFEDLAYIMKHIDTSRGILATNNLVSYFGKVSWSDILGAPISESKKAKLLYAVTPEFKLPSAIKGSFSYIDFSKSTVLDGWYKGSGCGNIKIEYSNQEQKALKTELAMTQGSLSELIYEYGYQENMLYTPYIEFAFEINDTENSLYEVTVAIENAETRFESSCAVAGNTPTNLVLDMSEYAIFGPVKNIKIFVRSLDGNCDKCTLWLYEVTGHSLDYDTSEIEELVLKERERTNYTKDNKTVISLKNILIAIGILVITGVFCAAIVVIFRRDNRSNDE